MMSLPDNLMTNSTYGNNIQPVFFLIPAMVMIMRGLICFAHRTPKIGCWLYFSISNCTSKFYMGFVFFWIVFSILFYNFSVRLPSIWRADVFFYSIQNLLFVIFIVNFTLHRIAIFTPITISALLTFILTKERNIFYFSAFTTSFIHCNLQNKMPIVLRSSSKRQAKLILTHNALARPNTLINGIIPQ